MCAKRPDLMVSLGHDGPPAQYWRENLIDGRELQICPVRTLQMAPVPLLREMRRHVDEYHPLFEKGHLLVEGGVADQPARYLDWMRAIDATQKLVDLKAAELKAKDGDE